MTMRIENETNSSTRQSPSNKKTRLESSWALALNSEFEKDYMKNLSQFLRAEKAKGKTIYPKAKEFFAALDYTPLKDVKVVILGQDPYHGEGQAHGLSFSVRPHVVIPPSLKNIYKELIRDLKIPTPDHGCLVSWAKQGVLLLNATLSVEASQAGSHQKKGWEEFTDNIIRKLSAERKNLVYLLWGSYAQKKMDFLDNKNNLILTAPHPSPLSAHRGFLGCNHFSKANEYLAQTGHNPIDWSLPPKKDLPKELSEV
jgi:uracil-DNA glycosylase